VPRRNAAREVLSRALDQLTFRPRGRQVCVSLLTIADCLRSLTREDWESTHVVMRSFEHDWAETGFALDAWIERSKLELPQNATGARVIPPGADRAGS